MSDNSSYVAIMMLNHGMNVFRQNRQRQYRVRHGLHRFADNARLLPERTIGGWSSADRICDFNP
jgi:hypothetical protein